MSTSQRSRPRRGYQPIRRLALQLGRIGVTSEVVSMHGMIFGILAGGFFMWTGMGEDPDRYWVSGMIFCLLRIVTIRLDQAMQLPHQRSNPEEYSFSEVPERVSDAVTLIGFGFAVDSDPWLGLAAALAAILSAYVRSYAVMRGAARKSASSGPMTRTHRLLLVSVTAIVIVLPLPSDRVATPIPIIALWVILVGCVATILIRWLNLQAPAKS